VNIVLVSTYELGHQPFGLASAQAWLKRDGHHVACVDLAVGELDESAVRDADLVAFYLPMHTATRLALPVVARVRRLHPGARLAAYGLYAPLNADLLRGLGVETVIGGEFESVLARLARGERIAQASLDKLAFLPPDRESLPPLSTYARLSNAGNLAIAGYTEASRGCKHLCRHCPVVPVYQGEFRVVQRDVVLEDIRRQVAAGARHITFGDPDFFNGPSHAMRIVTALHAEFPGVTYDATIKIEHLKKHRGLLGSLKQTGCLFVTSAVESLDDAVLATLRKNHTRRDFLEVAGWMREAGLTLQPTFLAFTPWTTLDGYRELLDTILDLELVENTAPVQLALRLLITWNSPLLELDDVRERTGSFDSQLLVYPWTHADPRVDALAGRVFHLVHAGQEQGRSRSEIFAEIWEEAHGGEPPDNFRLLPRAAIPYLNEPWYC
jgi:radical SAM superfamily enzyme YgiQ (UPF0313 family)